MPGFYELSTYNVLRRVKSMLIATLWKSGNRVRTLVCIGEIFSRFSMDFLVIELCIKIPKFIELSHALQCRKNREEIIIQPKYPAIRMELLSAVVQFFVTE